MGETVDRFSLSENGTGSQDHLQHVEHGTSSQSEALAESPLECLSRLNEILSEPIPEKPTAQYITDTAQSLVDNLNAKRKNDVQLLEQFRQALETMTVKMMERVQSQLYQTYETQSALVDQKLQELFTCLDNISATETDLHNFRQSLQTLYQEIHEGQK